MTIHSIGSDLTRIERLREVHERRGEALLERLFTPGERAYCDARKARFTHYAGRFAVKEAVMKVLGTGWSRGVRWVDIETTRDPGAAPQLVLHGRAREIAAELGIARVHITITHDAGLALAVAVAERVS
jgi:holo-[acyl-carrier protein] synthase